MAYLILIYQSIDFQMWNMMKEEKADHITLQFIVEHLWQSSTWLILIANQLYNWMLEHYQ